MVLEVYNRWGVLVFENNNYKGKWDGKNTNGTKVASGVYLIICRDDSGVEKIATKITIVQGR